MDILDDKDLAKLPGLKEHLIEIKKFWDSYSNLVKSITDQTDMKVIRNELKTLQDLINTLNFFTETLGNVNKESFEALFKAFNNTSIELENRLDDKEIIELMKDYSELPEA